MGSQAVYPIAGKAKAAVIKADVWVLEINLPPEVSAEVVKVLLILSENGLNGIVKLVMYKAMIAGVRYVKRIFNDLAKTKI